MKVEVPGAELGNGKSKPHLFSGDCLTSYPPPKLDPGEMFTRRYLLSGDFRIVQPCRYDVVLEKGIRYGTQSPGMSPPFPMPNEETAKLRVTLIVLPADPARLLAIERELAQQVTAPVDTRQVHELEGIETRDSIAEGLAAYPTAGMEPIFDDWMVSENSHGLAGLLKLNTPTARRFIAGAADPSPQVVLRWHQHVYTDETPERLCVYQYLAITSECL